MDAVHPTFDVTVEQAVGEFRRYEAFARQGRKISFNRGQKMWLTTAGEMEVSLYVALYPITERARRDGYQFGSTRPKATEADRADLIGVLSRTYARHARAVPFAATLEAVGDAKGNENVSLPRVRFELVSKSGKRLGPDANPSLVLPNPRDILDHGAKPQPFKFPLYVDGDPQITNQMTQLVLIALVADEEVELTFDL